MMEAAVRKPNVMFVDDEPRVLKSMRALFRRDYNVHLANSGDEALALLEKEDMDVIVSDQRMPGMTGVDVLKACKLRSPRSMRILLTGYADKDAITASINEGEVFRYLTKPCARDTLRETVALAVSAAGIDPGAEAVTGDSPGETQRPPIDPAEPPARPAAELPRFESPSPAGAAGSTVTAAAPDTRPRPQPKAHASPRNTAVDLLLISTDQQFTASLESALGMTHRLHTVTSVQDAAAVLEANPIGVVITDIAVNGDAVQSLTTELKHYVPELVTIVASDHSDAHRLIDLINGGQVFRFLLKPIKPKQTAIWIESAVAKHLALVTNPELKARHAVSSPGTSLLRFGEGLFKNIADRLLRFRDRGAVGAAGGSDTP